jgi:hypothetical protein
VAMVRAVGSLAQIAPAVTSPVRPGIPGDGTGTMTSLGILYPTVHKPTTMYDCPPNSAFALMVRLVVS